MNVVTMERLGIEKTFFWSEMGAPDGDGSARHSRDEVAQAHW